MHPTVKLGNFGAGIIADTSAPEGALELSATMRLLLEDQDDLRITGKIRGSAARARAELYVLL